MFSYMVLPHISVNFRLGLWNVSVKDYQLQANTKEIIKHFLRLCTVTSQYFKIRNLSFTSAAMPCCVFTQLSMPQWQNKNVTSVYYNCTIIQYRDKNILYLKIPKNMYYCADWLARTRLTYTCWSLIFNIGTCMMEGEEIDDKKSSKRRRSFSSIAWDTRTRRESGNNKSKQKKRSNNPSQQRKQQQQQQ